MTRITMLGMGAMGTRMASRLSTAGFAVTTWSRSRAATSIAEAVKDAEVILSMVSDDDASRSVWSEAFAACAAGGLAIECSTVSARRAIEWGQEATARGLVALEAPVVGSRPQADAGSLTVLAGGSSEALARAQPVLAAISSTVHHVGPLGAGAHVKLLVNGLFATQVALVAELLSAAAHAGLDPSRVVHLLGGLPVTSPAAKGAAEAMVAGRFDPQFPFALVAKDLRYATEAFRSSLLSAARARFDAAVDAGLGEKNLTAVALLG
jgi:3-hydroxyisobutyrate dehydrogenase